MSRQQGDSSGFRVFIIGREISVSFSDEIRSTLLRNNIKIQGERRRSREDFQCLEISIIAGEGFDKAILQNKLASMAATSSRQTDIAVLPEEILKRPKRLLAIDFDSTLIQNETIDELARVMGVYDEVTAITGDAMAGKLDYDSSLRRRCEKLKGLASEQIIRVSKSLKLTQGAETLIRAAREQGCQTAIISGSFTIISERFKENLKIDHVFGNTLEIKNGSCTGLVLPPIVNAERKAWLLEMLAKKNGITLDETIAVGDGANDLLMIKKAGIGVAFNAKAKLKANADLALDQNSLVPILFLFENRSHI